MSELSDAYSLVEYYRAQATNLDGSDADITDAVVRDLRRKYDYLSLQDALRLTAATLKRGEAWGTIDDEPVYRENWPYNFKWNFNNVTGEPHVWAVKGGTDGMPVHRQMYTEQNWNRSDLAMGVAAFRPPDGSTPAQVTIRYYPHTTTFVPEPIIQWMTRLFPAATIQTSVFDAGLRGMR